MISPTSGQLAAFVSNASATSIDGSGPTPLANRYFAHHNGGGGGIFGHCLKRTAAQLPGSPMVTGPLEYPHGQFLGLAGSSSTPALAMPPLEPSSINVASNAATAISTLRMSASC